MDRIVWGYVYISRAGSNKVMAWLPYSTVIRAPLEYFESFSLARALPSIAPQQAEKNEIQKAF